MKKLLQEITKEEFNYMKHIDMFWGVYREAPEF